jgi:2-(1,2-epoxy-1,2-dihydrophenyl)acetyl-CoA isomerase
MSVVKVDRLPDRIARVAIDRPDKRNALNAEVRTGLIDALTDVLYDDDVHAVLLGSQGGYFCAGGDIDSMAGLDAAAARARMKQNARIVRLLADSEKPVVAAVEGYAVGAGAGLALLADTIVLGEGAVIGFPFFNVGLIPDYGILHTLPRRVGDAKARQILLYACMIKGEDAVDIGLADELAADGAAEETALENARKLAAMPPYAFALARRHLAVAPVSLDAALEMEALGQAGSFLTADFAEGREAFQQKRKPKFR